MRPQAFQSSNKVTVKEKDVLWMYLLLQGWRPDAYLPHPCSDTQNLAWVEGYHVQVWGEVLLIIKNNKYMYIIPCTLFQIMKNTVFWSKLRREIYRSTKGERCLPPVFVTCSLPKQFAGTHWHNAQTVTMRKWSKLSPLI